MTWRDALIRRFPLLIAAGAVWVTAGVVSPTGADATTRLAVLPPAWVALALLLVATAIGWLPIAAERLRPLYLSALLWLPWLPLPIPAAFLLWHGPLAWAVWVIIAWLLVARTVRAWWMRVLAAPPRRQLALALAVAGVYMLAAWRMAPVLPGGDEPHYLVITQSLLYDGDLKIENNHQRGDYRAYFRQDLKPDFLRRGIDHEIYSIHAPGVSALVLPAFAVAGYPGVIVFLAVVSALGGALVWRTGWRLTGDAAAAWAGWAAVAMTAPFLLQAFTVYPDGPAAVLVMTGVYGLACPGRLAASRWRIVAHGAALAALPWLHTRYAVLAGTLGVLLLLRLRRPSGAAGLPVPAGRPWIRQALAFLAVPAVSATAWLWSFYAIYGELNPAAPYGTYTQADLGNVPRGLAGLLVDQQFGVLPNAPVYLLAFIGIGALARRHRRLAIELLLVAVPYVLAVASYHMWWGGHSSPARFIVPVLLPFGVAASAQWGRGTPGARAIFGGLLCSSLALAAALVWVDRGALVYNFRDGFARWMDSAAPLVNLPRAVPTLFRNSRAVTALLVAAWAAAAALSWLLVRPRPRDGDGGGATLRPWIALACTMMLGTTLGWRIAGASPIESGTGLLRVARAAAVRGTVVRLPALRREPAAQALAHVRLPSALRRDRPADGLLFVARDLPAGRYRVIAKGPSVLSGTLEATVGRRVLPLMRTALDHAPPGGTPMLLDLPAGAQVLTITADEAARRSIDEVALQVEVFRGGPEGSFAHRVVRYGETLVWFLDEGVFAETEGWWVRGRWSAVVLLDTAPGGSAGALLIRNGGVPNRVTLTVGSWEATLDLAPGEERPIDVPAVAGRAPLRVTSEAGFRPADVDPASRDMRVLGVWVQPR